MSSPSSLPSGSPVARPSGRAQGLLAAAVTVSVWTAFIVIARASAGHHLAPLDIGLLRIVGASLVLLPWSWWRLHRGPSAGQGEHWLGLSPYRWQITVPIGLFGGFFYAILAYAGFFYAPAAHGSVLMPGSLPLWTSLLALVVLGERIARPRVIGLILIVCGDLLVGGLSLLKALDGGEVWKGDLMFMSAAFCWGCYTVLTRRHRLEPVPATMAVTLFALFTYVPLYGLGWATGYIDSHLAQASASELVFQLMFQGMGSVVVAGIAFTRMVQAFGPVRSSMITAVVPGLSALGAVVFLGEPLYWNLLAGLALVTVGIVFGVSLSAAGVATHVVRAAGKEAA